MREKVNKFIIIFALFLSIAVGWELVPAITTIDPARGLIVLSIAIVMGAISLGYIGLITRFDAFIQFIVGMIGIMIIFNVIRGNSSLPPVAILFFALLFGALWSSITLVLPQSKRWI